MTALVLLACTGTSLASVQSGHEEKVNCEINYPIVTVEGNDAASAKINSDINIYVNHFRQAYTAGQFISGSINYNVTYEDDNFVSLVMTDYRYNGGAHGTPVDIGRTYYKKTGQLLPLPFFVLIRPGDAGYIYNQPVYGADGKEIPKDQLNSNYASKPVSDNYVLMGGAKVKLLYQRYDLAAYAAGGTSIVLDQKLIDYLNRKNR